MISKPESNPVRVEPLGIVLDCNPEETLIRCAWRSAYYWPTICGGAAECGACWCEVIDGRDNVAPMGTAEAIVFRMYPKLNQPGRAIRLACCMTVTGPVTVTKAGVKPR
jgi:ferredoxin